LQIELRGAYDEISYFLLGIILINGTAQADSPSFTYVELEYVAAGDIELSDGGLSASVDLDGFALNASLELGILLLQASRFELESDAIFGSELQDNISTIAVGLTFELPKTAVYALVRGRNDDVSISGGLFNEDDDLSSVGIEAGARINLTDRFEINANVGRPSVDAGTSSGVGVYNKKFGYYVRLQFYRT